MKIILGILCGIMVLFAGGCALAAGGTGPLALIPAAVAALNVFVLLALFGGQKPIKPVFIALVVLDALVVIGLGLLWASFGWQDHATNMFGALLIGAFAVKGVLTYLFLRQIPAAS